MIVYTKQTFAKRSKKRKQPKKKPALRGSAEFWPDLSVPTRGASTSNTIPGNGFKKSVDDYKWKKTGKEEKPEVIAATEEKKKRVAPYTNKGAYMFVTDGADKITLGRKV